ncbi:MAG: hypothetical protein CMF62_02440 [Magnetococcales bacterium]|nr:hypothetical protein [Magnetococcales bacterium]|tara:strand:- start:20222 stop:21607 length:1386 start_codon:yes stop_codon:yes gene_type:complete
MEIYTDKDIALLEENIDSINDKIQEIKYKTFDPKKEEMDAILKVVLDYVEKNKRKVYGGTAHNAVIKHKNKIDAFYKDTDIPDIDIYSPEPLVDIMTIANQLVDLGYTDIEAREAQHKDTYSLFVKRTNYLDVSYVPKNIFNRMPFIEIDNIYYIHPYFAMIDYYRMLNDPMTSYFRIGKSFKRLKLLQRHFPINKLEKKVKTIEKPNEDTEKVLNEIFTFLKNKESTILVGDYAYNYFLKESNLKESFLSELPISRYDFISADYKNDGIELIKLLRSKFGDGKIKVAEYYPFFQFFGYNSIISFNDKPVCRIYHHNDKCLTYQDVKLGKDFIRIASFNLIAMYYMTHMMYARTNKNKEKKCNMNTYLSHLFMMRNNYLKKNKKTIFDTSPFEEFTIKCIGKTLEPAMEFAKRIKERKSKGKPLIWTYRPLENRKEAEQNYIYGNLSGNIINNPKNLQLTK